jgi:hypothetical protein
MAIEIKFGCVANVASRMIHFEKAGDVEPSHTHSFDHLTLLAAGAVRCTVNNQVTEFRAPHMIFIAKEYMHSFEALTDNTVAYCIHAMRIGERVEDLADPTMFPNGVPIPQSVFNWWSPPENYNGSNKDVMDAPSTLPSGELPQTLFT